MAEKKRGVIAGLSSACGTLLNFTRRLVFNVIFLFC